MTWHFHINKSIQVCVCVYCLFVLFFFNRLMGFCVYLSLFWFWIFVFGVLFSLKWVICEKHILLYTAVHSVSKLKFGFLFLIIKYISHGHSIEISLSLTMTHRCWCVPFKSLCNNFLCVCSHSYNTSESKGDPVHIFIYIIRIRICKTSNVVLFFNTWTDINFVANTGWILCECSR